MVRGNRVALDQKGRVGCEMWYQRSKRGVCVFTGSRIQEGIF
jgi:hypothetical protein